MSTIEKAARRLADRSKPVDEAGPVEPVPTAVPAPGAEAARCDRPDGSSSPRDE